MNKLNSKQISVILFSMRLFFYLSVILLIFAHPGIAVSFDLTGIVQWLVIIPLMAVLAFIQVAPRNERKKNIITLSVLVILSIIAGGFTFGAFVPFFTGVLSFLLVILLFQPQKIPQFAGFAKIAALEPFFLVWVCLRLLSLSRSGEDAAGQSIALTQFILVWALVVFLLHSAVIYLCLYPKSVSKSWKEGLVFFLASLSALIIMMIVLPPDFVRNSVVNNLLSERIPELIKPSDTDRGIPKRGNGRRTLPQGQDKQNGLRGIPEHEWPGRSGGSDDNRQYMVMVVASASEPVYMGNVFRGKLDPVEGFLLSPEEHLNTLANQRLFITWSNNENNNDSGRMRQDIFSLSTLQQKYFPWRPISVDPVILNDNSGPLRYIHQVVSIIHSGDPLLLVHKNLRSLSRRERTSLEHYLDLPLEADDMRVFSSWLNDALDNWRKNRETIINDDSYLKEIFSGYDTQTVNNEYFEKIIAILAGFSKYQYNLSYDDTYSIASLKEFLLSSAEGDCVEFSNTFALLGRIAGIPSRVVTGYLAAEGLQTHAHLRGLAALRAKIPILQQFPFDDLYLVTNLHSHSWTQFYIPGYGWLDFEATSFAIPPEGMGDFNTWDVVIPLIDENRTISQVRKFPWRAAGRTLLVLVIAAVVCAYALRYGRELFLYASARKGGRKGARSLYLLLLARLAADGRPIKPASKTAHEYSELFQRTEDKEQRTKNRGQRTKSKEQRTENDEILHLKAFADIYSEIRWRDYDDPAELDSRFQILYQEYKAILSTRKRGLIQNIKRIFNLRGLAYL